MLAYASRTGTRRNIASLRAAGWRMLVSATGAHRHEGMPYAVDNGAWSAFQQQAPWDEVAFSRLVSSHGRSADFVVVPDVVADANASLRQTSEWLPRLAESLPIDGPKLLVAVQDGMAEQDVAPWIGGRVGVFLGGSTEWKLATMRRWGDLCSRRGVWYHVGRVNSAKRIRACAESGATSFDGTSVTMYADTLPPLDMARREGTLDGPAWTDPPRDYAADAATVAAELASYRDDDDVWVKAGALRAMLDAARGCR